MKLDITMPVFFHSCGEELDHKTGRVVGIGAGPFTQLNGEVYSHYIVLLDSPILRDGYPNEAISITEYCLANT